MRTYVSGLKLFLLTVAIVLFTENSGIAANEYKLQPGDVLSFAVPSISALDSDLTVDPDGKVNVPLVGWQDTSGLTVRDLETRIRDTISGSIYLQRSSGDELPLIVHGEEIFLQIKGFRPIFVGGDVRNPGRQDFVPLLTVRQAVAVAGGIELTPARQSEEQLRRVAALKADYGALMASYVASLAEVGRIKGELSGDWTMPEGELSSSDLPAPIQDEIARKAGQFLEISAKLDAAERSHLAKAIQQNSYRVNALREQQEQEQQGANFDKSELERIQDLANRGAVQPTRAAEARRDLIVSSSRALSTKADLEAAEIRQAELVYTLDSLDEQKKLKNLTDLSAATRELNRLHAQLAGTAEQIALNTSGDVMPADATQIVTVQIFRNGEPLSEDGGPGMETLLQPGDMVEVTTSLTPPTPAAVGAKQ